VYVDRLPFVNSALIHDRPPPKDPFPFVLTKCSRQEEPPPNVGCEGGRLTGIAPNLRPPLSVRIFGTHSA